MDPVSRENEPSGFARVFVPLVGAAAVAALAWIVRQPRGNPDPWADAAPYLPEQEQQITDAYRSDGA